MGERGCLLSSVQPQEGQPTSGRCRTCPPGGSPISPARELPLRPRRNLGRSALGAISPRPAGLGRGHHVEWHRGHDVCADLGGNREVDQLVAGRVEPRGRPGRGIERHALRQGERRPETAVAGQGEPEHPKMRRLGRNRPRLRAQPLERVAARGAGGVLEERLCEALRFVRSRRPSRLRWPCRGGS